MSISSTFSKLTTVGRLCVIILLVGIIGAGVWFGGKTLGVKLGESNDGKYDAVLLVDTYTGWHQLYGATEVKKETMSPSSTRGSE